MRIYETWSEIGQNEVKSIWPVAWLRPGFHPRYPGAEPKFCALFCQWFAWSYSRFLSLWLRLVSWPVPIELSSPLVSCLHIYHTFSSLKNRLTFNYLLRLLQERQLLKFMLWSNRLGIGGWIYRPFHRLCRLELSDGRAGPMGTWPKSPVPADGFSKLNLVLTSNFCEGHRWRSSRKLPLGFGFTEVLGNKCSILKAMCLGHG